MCIILLHFGKLAKETAMSRKSQLLVESRKIKFKEIDVPIHPLARTCSFCNDGKHYRSQCPAVNEYCRKCGIIGHFKVACHNYYPYDVSKSKNNYKKINWGWLSRNKMNNLIHINCLSHSLTSCIINYFFFLISRCVFDKLEKSCVVLKYYLCFITNNNREDQNYKKKHSVSQ